MTLPIDELIEKLNSLADCDARAGAPLGKCMREAASTLTSLQERNRKLEEALKPFADCVEQISPDESDEEWAKFRLLIGDYRRAARALLGAGE